MAILKSLRRSLLPAWMRYLNKSFRSRRKLEDLVRDHGLRPLEANPLGAGKSSGTLFILWSGASVNTYSQAEWDAISRHDSLGFNFWILHPFVPTRYVFEYCKDASSMECLKQNLEARRDYGTATPLFLKDAERFDRGAIGKFIQGLSADRRGHLRLMWDAEIPFDSLAGFIGTLTRLDRLGCFSANRLWAVPRNKATLFLAANLAVRAGYREIVLCGRNLNNTDYFYRDEGFAAGAPGLCFPPVLQSGAVHKTNDPQEGEVTISALLDAFDRAILQPRGIQLSVAKSSSALHPRFPAYFD